MTTPDFQEQNPIVKLPIVKETSLKLYVFSVRPPDSPIIPQQASLILSHSLDDALAKLSVLFKDSKYSATELGFVPVSFLFDRIDQKLDQVLTLPVQLPSELQFFQGLSLAADSFVTDEKDKTSLKKILKKLETSHEQTKSQEIETSVSEGKK